MTKTRVLVAGAAGRDFHNFNVVYRGRDDYEIVGFTATQIPNIDGRVYPAELAGEAYPDGIPIMPEADLVISVPDSGNAAAKAFYRGHGFTECGSSPGYYEDVEDAVRMVKRLA